MPQVINEILENRIDCINKVSLIRNSLVPAIIASFGQVGPTFKDDGSLYKKDRKRCEEFEKLAKEHRVNLMIRVSVTGSHLAATFSMSYSVSEYSCDHINMTSPVWDSQGKVDYEYKDALSYDEVLKNKELIGDKQESIQRLNNAISTLRSEVYPALTR